MIGHRARSRGLDSGEVCRKPSSTCNQALDLKLETSFSVRPIRRSFNGQFIQSFTTTWILDTIFLICSFCTAWLSPVMGNSELHKAAHFPLEWLWLKENTSSSREEIYLAVISTHWSQVLPWWTLLWASPFHLCSCFENRVFPSGSLILESFNHPLCLREQITFFSPWNSSIWESPCGVLNPGLYLLLPCPLPKQKTALIRG